MAAALPVVLGALKPLTDVAGKIFEGIGKLVGGCIKGNAKEAIEGAGQGAFGLTPDQVRAERGMTSQLAGTFDPETGLFRNKTET